MVSGQFLIILLVWIIHSTFVTLFEDIFQFYFFSRRVGTLLEDNFQLFTLSEKNGNTLSRHFSAFYFFPEDPQRFLKTFFTKNPAKDFSTSKVS